VVVASHLNHTCAATQELRGALGRRRGPDGLDLGPIWVQAGAGTRLAWRAGLVALVSAAGGAWCARVCSPLRCTIVSLGSSVDIVLAPIPQGSCPALP
jgi:hypothetical protein